MTKFLNKFNKNPIFGLFLVHVQNFSSKKRFYGKFSPVTHNLIWISRAMWKFRKKLQIQFQENAPTEGRKDRHNLFHRTLPATAGGQNKQMRIYP